MPKDLERYMKDLSLSSESKPKTDTRKRYEKLSSPIRASQASSTPDGRSAKYRERWVYGFHLKNRYVRRICEKFGVPYETRPVSSLFKVQAYLRNCCRMPYAIYSMHYRGRPALFVVFLKDDERKRENMNRFTEEQMERVRILLLLPDGEKPKWYSDSDNCESYDDLSSEDEDMPHIPNEFPPTTHKDEEIVPAKPYDESTHKEPKENDGKYISDDDDYFLVSSDEEHDSDQTEWVNISSGSHEPGRAAL